MKFTHSKALLAVALVGLLAAVALIFHVFAGQPPFGVADQGPQTVCRSVQGHLACARVGYLGSSSASTSTSTSTAQ